MLEVVILLLLGTVLALALGVFVWVYPFLGMLRSLGSVWSQTQADYGSEGGIASAAKRGSKKFLAEMVKTVMFNFSGGLSEVATEAFPVIEEWMEKNPAAVIYAFSMLRNIPAVQGFLKGFMQGGLQLPEVVSPQGEINYAEKEKAWWQA